jgi:hypothetical protein
MDAIPSDLMSAARFEHIDKLLPLSARKSLRDARKRVRHVEWWWVL